MEGGKGHGIPRSRVCLLAEMEEGDASKMDPAVTVPGGWKIKISSTTTKQISVLAFINRNAWEKSIRDNHQDQWKKEGIRLEHAYPSR